MASYNEALPIYNKAMDLAVPVEAVVRHIAKGTPLPHEPERENPT